MPNIPEGSLVLVTGANGFIASHIVEELLSAGYTVRGTVRSPAKLARLQARWDQKYGVGKFKAATVEDISKEGAFDEAVKGVSGIAHVASILSFSSKPEEVVDPTVNATLSLLRSAAAEPSVKSVVLTSSSSAAIWPKTNVEFDIGEDSWNEESVKNAYNMPDDNPFKAWHVYGASKTLGEKAAWKFVKDEKPTFAFNSILPNANFGPILDPESSASTAGWIVDTFHGKDSALKSAPPQWFVDVRDTARLHVLALTSPSLASGGVRVWAVAEPYTYNLILQALRKIYPSKKFPEDVEGLGRDLSRIDNKRASELLGGWRSLEESLRANTDHL